MKTVSAQRLEGFLASQCPWGAAAAAGAAVGEVKDGVAGFMPRLRLDPRVVLDGPLAAVAAGFDAAAALAGARRGQQTA